MTDLHTGLRLALACAFTFRSFAPVVYIEEKLGLKGQPVKAQGAALCVNSELFRTESPACF